MSTLILIETSVTGSGAAIFKSAQNMGVHLVFLYRDLEQYKAIGIQNYLNEGVTAVELDTTSYTVLQNFLYEYQQTHSLDGIICLNDRCIEHAARLAELYNLAFMNANAVVTCRNKDQTALLGNKIGIRTPKTYSCHTMDELEQAVQGFEYPLILKPSRGFGSTDVLFCEHREALEKLAPQVLETAVRMNGSLLLQEYILGPLVSVETITYQGKTRILGVTDRIMGPLPNFVEVGSSFPVDLGTKKMTELYSVMHQLIEALEIQNGITHTEFILTEDGPVLIEINPRLGGGLVGKMISAAFGFDLFSDIIRLALGQEPMIPVTHVHALSECFIYPEKEGRITRISGLQLAKNSPGIVEVFHKTPEGASVNKASNYISRAIMGVLSKGDTSDIAAANCRAALNQVRVEYCIEAG